MQKSAQMEFKSARCSGILSAHPSPRLWLQPCCQTSHWEGAAHRKSRRHPAPLPYDRCKPSSIGRSPLHPRPATHGKSTSIQARAKTFKCTVWIRITKGMAGHIHFHVLKSNWDKRKFYFRQCDKCPTLCLAERKRKCVFLSILQNAACPLALKVLGVIIRLSEWRLPPFQCWTRHNLIFPHLNAIVIEVKSNY